MIVGDAERIFWLIFLSIGGVPLARDQRTVRHNRTFHATNALDIGRLDRAARAAAFQVRPFESKPDDEADATDDRAEDSEGNGLSHDERTDVGGRLTQGSRGGGEVNSCRRTVG